MCVCVCVRVLVRVRVRVGAWVSGGVCVCVRTHTHAFLYACIDAHMHASKVDREGRNSVKRDLLQCQKRPTTVLYREGRNARRVKVTPFLYSTKRLELLVLPDRALCLPTFSHFLIQQNFSLSLSLSLSTKALGGFCFESTLSVTHEKVTARHGVCGVGGESRWYALLSAVLLVDEF